MLETLRLGVTCPDSFRILAGSQDVLYNTKHLSLAKSGALKHFFRNSNGDKHSFILQFEDMSLHYIDSNMEQNGDNDLVIIWSREEALSDIL